MKNFFYKPILFLLMATICMATQCPKKDRFPSYNFTEKINLYPEQSIYQLGDTIWLQHVGTNLYDNKSNQYFSTDTLAIAFGLQTSTVYNLPPDTTNVFCDFILNGKNMGSQRGYYFGCGTGESFNFTLGMVLIKKGTFSIDLNAYLPVSSCSSSNYYDGEGFPPSSVNYQLNITDGHKDIYLGVTPARRADPKDYVYNALKAKKMFFFKVE
ncbi:MAG: hypothetical protein ABI374_02560 [Ginsengibacter sp.]